MPGQTTTLKLPYPTPDDTVDVPRDVAALAQAIDPLGVVPVGCMMMWPTSAAPNGWLLCQGQQVDAATYPVLAQLLGQVAGKITLPSLQDKFPVGASSTRPIGAGGGAETVALATPQLPSHGHGGAVSNGGAHAHTLSIDNALVVPPGGYVIPFGGGIVNQVTGSGSLYNVPANNTGPWAGGTQGPHTHTGQALTAGDHAHGLTINPTGGGQAHENMPPYLAVNYIIRAG